METDTLIMEQPQNNRKLHDLKENDLNFRHMYINYEELETLLRFYSQQKNSGANKKHIDELKKKRDHLKHHINRYLYEH